MAKKRNYEEMIAMAENILNPAASGLSEMGKKYLCARDFAHFIDSFEKL